MGGVESGWAAGIGTAAWRALLQREVNKIDSMIMEERGMGATHSERPYVESVQEETPESEESREEDTGMFSEEALRALGWEYGLPRFYVLLLEMGRIHSKKNHDYTSIHPLENFFRTAMDVGITPEQVVEVFISTKSVRIRTLLQSESGPMNESLRDSYIDRAVYSMLGAAIAEMTPGEQFDLFAEIATNELFEECSECGQELEDEDEA